MISKMNSSGASAPPRTAKKLCPGRVTCEENDMKCTEHRSRCSAGLACGAAEGQSASGPVRRTRFLPRRIAGRRTGLKPRDRQRLAGQRQWRPARRPRERSNGDRRRGWNRDDGRGRGQDGHWVWVADPASGAALQAFALVLGMGERLAPRMASLRTSRLS